MATLTPGHDYWVGLTLEKLRRCRVEVVGTNIRARDGWVDAVAKLDGREFPIEVEHHVATHRSSPDFWRKIRKYQRRSLDRWGCILIVVPDKRTRDRVRYPKLKVSETKKGVRYPKLPPEQVLTLDELNRRTIRKAMSASPR